MMSTRCAVASARAAAVIALLLVASPVPAGPLPVRMGDA